MAAIEWLPDAVRDLERLHAFIEPHSPRAAARAVATIVDAAQSLRDFPEKGRPWELDADFRELPVKFASRGYVIRYRLNNGTVIVVRVWHALEDR